MTSLRSCTHEKVMIQVDDDEVEEMCIHCIGRRVRQRCCQQKNIIQDLNQKRRDITVRRERKNIKYADDKVMLAKSSEL